MRLRFVYPVDLTIDEAGRHLATFPDVPEAGDDGASEAEALAGAKGALVAALVGYIEGKRDVPAPSKPRRGQRTVALDPLAAAKLALWQAMRERDLSKTALGAMLGESEAAVRRLLDLEHHSRIAAVEAALAALDKRIVTEVEDAA